LDVGELFGGGAWGGGHWEDGFSEGVVKEEVQNMGSHSHFSLRLFDWVQSLQIAKGEAQDRHQRLMVKREEAT